MRMAGCVYSCGDSGVSVNHELLEKLLKQGAGMFFAVLAIWGLVLLFEEFTGELRAGRQVCIDFAHQSLNETRRELAAHRREDSEQHTKIKDLCTNMRENR